MKRLLESTGETEIAAVQVLCDSDDVESGEYWAQKAAGKDENDNNFPPLGHVEGPDATCGYDHKEQIYDAVYDRYDLPPQNLCRKLRLV